jgi:collagenase-like PrtC family protease
MKLAVGYPVIATDVRTPFLEAVRKFGGQIEEVYFAWPGDPSGRAPAGGDFGRPEPSARERLESDLQGLKRMGLGLDLLLNANCYGHLAVSRRLARHACSLVEHLGGLVGLDAVTAASPFIAGLLKEHFPDLDVRASVNMRIGTVQGMVCVADLFDSFYVQRECNRDIARVSALHEWCRSHGKRLFMLANSGCLAFCPAQTFHDNVIAHEADIARTDNAPCETLVCRQHLKDNANWAALLAATWVRPEDLDRYDAFCAGAKLATRMHARPELVISAYARRNFGGNLLDLLEPGHGDLLGGRLIDNAAFPEDWFERTSSCGRDCQNCDYCRRVLERVLVVSEPAEALGR